MPAPADSKINQPVGVCALSAAPLGFGMRHPRAVGVVVNHVQALTQCDGEALRAVTTNTSLAKGRDPRYLTAGAGGGHAGGTRYYSEAAGEPPGQWAGRGAGALGLAGSVDTDTLQALYMDRVGPDGERLDARARPRYRPAREREDLAARSSRCPCCTPPTWWPHGRRASAAPTRWQRPWRTPRRRSSPR